MVSKSSNRLGVFRCIFRIVAAILVLSQGAVAAETPAACSDANECNFHAQQLSDQSSDPFMFGGRIVDESHPRWKTFRRAIRKFPSVESCLKPNDHEEGELNLLDFDWDRVGTGRNLEICLFRIARSLQNVDRLNEWLMAAGFRAGTRLQRYTAEYGQRVYERDKARGRETPLVNLNVGMSMERYRELNPSLFVTLTGIEFVQGTFITFQLSKGDKVVGVQISSIIK